MLTNKYIYLSSLCLMVFGFTSQNLLSQSSDSRLEEVVVTAQKKEQGLSEVPISISVMSGERMAQLGVTTLEGLSTHVPGLVINKGAGEMNIYMRGVGSGANKGFSQSITQFIDGMPIIRGQQYLTPLLDVERVEVLKGAQGVLFGKNTIERSSDRRPHFPASVTQLLILLRSSLPVCRPSRAESSLGHTLGLTLPSESGGRVPTSEPSCRRHPSESSESQMTPSQLSRVARSFQGLNCAAGWLLERCSGHTRPTVLLHLLQH